MLVNMHMLAYDLEALGAASRIGARRTKRTLAFPQVCGEFPPTPRSDVAMIIDAGRLPEEPPECAKLSIICLGEPHERWRACHHDMIWVPQPPTREAVVNAVLESFWRYADWERRLLALAQAGAGLEDFARASQPLLRNPLSLHSASFRIIFQTFPEEEHPSEQLMQYRSYIPKGSEFIPDRDISIIANDPGFLQALERTDVTRFSPESYPTTTLMYSVRIDGAIRAYLTLDDVLAPHTIRDEAVLKALGDILARVITRDEAGGLMRPQALGNVLRTLLEHRKVLPDKQIENALKYLAWRIGDRFVALAIAPVSADKTETLSAVASSVSRALANDCVAIHGKTVCCVLNLTQLGDRHGQSLEKLALQAEKLDLHIGVSEQFDDFRELHYYYQQALACLPAGDEESGERIVAFEERAIDYILARIVGTSVAGVFVPDGLKRLIEHDRAKQTDYAHLVETFLVNERHITKTIAQEYLHRNTFNYRIKRAKEILGMDLDDPEVRFRLLVAFRILEAERSHSLGQGRA